MEKYKSNFQANKFYHVFNRANGDEKIFRSEENYRYFQQKFTQYILPIAHCWAFALLPNHFHFLIKIRNEGSLEQHAQFLDKSKENNHSFILQQFSNFQNAYAKAFNKMYQRKGSLFMERINRIELSKDSDISAAIFYIHKNPVHHHLAKTLSEWSHCSYSKILEEKSAIVQREQVLNFLGGKNAYIEFHKRDLLK